MVVPGKEAGGAWRLGEGASLGLSRPNTAEAGDTPGRTPEGTVYLLPDTYRTRLTAHLGTDMFFLWPGCGRVRHERPWSHVLLSLGGLGV